jgi:hypothetical protein
MELELGSLKSIFERYNQLIRERREKVGNTEWVVEWEQELSEKDRNIVQAVNALKSI